MVDKRRASGWMVAASLLVASACGGSPSAVRAPEPQPSIVVLDPGAQPRQRVRYVSTLHAPERAEQTIKLRIKTTLTNTVLETGNRSTDFPSVRIVGRYEAAERTALGDALVTYVIEDVVVLDDVVDPAIRRKVEIETTGMKGTRASWRMSSTGAVSDIAFDAPNPTRAMSSTLSRLGESVRHSVVVFPEAEIGVGATWRVTSRESSSRVNWDREVTFRLRALDGSTAAVDADVVMRAPSQALSVEPNATTRLTSGTNNSRMELVVPLHGLVATGTSQETGEMNLSIVRGRLRITSTVQSEAMSSVRPLAAASAGNEP